MSKLTVIPVPIQPVEKFIIRRPLNDKTPIQYTYKSVYDGNGWTSDLKHAEISSSWGEANSKRIWLALDFKIEGCEICQLIEK